MYEIIGGFVGGIIGTVALIKVLNTQARDEEVYKLRIDNKNLEFKVESRINHIDWLERDIKERAAWAESDKKNLQKFYEDRLLELFNKIPSIPVPSLPMAIPLKTNPKAKPGPKKFKFKK